eukprot:gene34420-biopygen29274
MNAAATASRSRAPVDIVAATAAKPQHSRLVASASAAAAEGEVQTYSTGLKWLHWAVGGSMATTVYYVKAAQWTDDKKLKGQYMQLHKSWALVALGLIVPRVALRLTSKMPGPLPGMGPFPMLEHYGAAASHLALYAGMLFLPISGVAMGYFGGKGLPFFGNVIPGASEPDGKIAGTAFKYHKLVGSWFPYLIPIHISGAMAHTFAGHTIWRRITPFV